MSCRLLKLPQTLDRAAEKKSGLYDKMARGLWVRPVRTGDRSVAWPEAEVEAILTLRAGGATDDQVRRLVSHLHAERERAARRVLDTIDAEVAAA